MGREERREKRREEWRKEWREEWSDGANNDGGAEGDLKTGGCRVGDAINDDLVSLAHIASNRRVRRVRNFGYVNKSKGLQGRDASASVLIVRVSESSKWESTCPVSCHL